MECGNCQSHLKDLWGPIFPHPELRTVENGNYISIRNCERCNQLWIYSPYEPYLAFPYLVKWEYTVDDWRLVHGKDDGHTLLEWHKAEVRRKLSATSQEDREAIESHRGRAYFHYNPIDFPSKNEIRMEETIMQLKALNQK